MSNSGLVQYTKISPSKTSPRNSKIVGIAIHTMAGDLTIESCGNVFQSAAASSNYGIDSKGRIGLYVSESDRSWCTSSASVDHRAVTIEVASTKNGDPWPCSDAAYKSLINLCVDICVRNDIKSLKWQANKSLGTSLQVDKQNMWAHRWFAQKSCPGDYLYSRFGNIASSVNSKLNSLSDAERKKILSGATYTPSGVDSSTSYDGAVGGEVYAPPVKAYVATIDQYSPNLDFKKFEDKDIVGVIVHAGRRFNSNHTVRSDFKNPRVDEQIKQITQSAVPFGFYFNACGRNTDEIREEIYDLSFIVRKYPPRLGLWLKTEFIGSRSTNDKLLNDYYNRLLKLGFARQLGLYVTPQQLRKITWNNHKDSWWLWRVEHFKSQSEIDGDISYDTFKTPEGDM